MRQILSIIAMFAASPALAEDTRQLDAHEHGVGALNIAIDGTTVAMEFHAPGADIVGFEYAAESEGDRAAVDRAVALLAAPLDLFEFPAAAECSVIQAKAGLDSEELQEDYALERDRDDHGENEDHSEDSGHESHDENGQAAQHAEFHAEYTLGCANSEALTNIFFGYFDTFSNAHELDVQIITTSGAQAFEVARDAPTLELQSLF